MKLPDYYVIKRDPSNPLWEKCHKWLISKGLDPTWQHKLINATYFGYEGLNGFPGGINVYSEIGDFNNRPTLITLEQWDEAVNPFVLPEKWCVKRTVENANVINDWANKKDNTHRFFNTSGYMHDAPYVDNVIKENYTEITFDQFKKGVLKENDMSKEELLAKAGRDYIIGTLFKSPCDHGIIREVKPYGNNKTVEFSYSKYDNTIRCSNGMFTEDINGNYACSNPLIYSNGKWAEIISQPNQEPMKDRTITAAQAQSIIDIACGTWKANLVVLWAHDICHKRDIEISETYYQMMRKACTDKQHTLFDSIFGKDKKEFTVSDLKEGDCMIALKGACINQLIAKINNNLINLSTLNQHYFSDQNMVSGKKVRIKNIEFEEVND